MEVKIMTPAGVLHDALQTANGSSHALAETPCPLCGMPELLVDGEVMHVVKAESHERCTEWEARSVCCGKPGFTIGVRMISLFGFEEDARVLHGRCRVY